MMKKMLGLVFSFSLSAFAIEAQPMTSLRILEAPDSLVRFASAEFGGSVRVLGKLSHESSIIAVDSNLIPALSAHSHSVTGHCGGFIDITGEKSDLNVPATNLNPDNQISSFAVPALGARKPEIERAIADVQPSNIENFDREYSSKFSTRDARTSEGANAPLWLKARWEAMADLVGRSDVKVELMPPPEGYRQSSVRITIPGESPSAPVVILGGHLDSINTSIFGKKAPGADDDASGISTLTEIYRIILKTNLRPRAAIQIFGYAAEELGLLGSRAIAESYRDQNIRVIGVLQLDMTSFPGKNKAVTFILDNVDPELTQWTEQVYGLYVGKATDHEHCGYACSDHASWNRYGFRSVMPFEAKMDDMNHNIHSANDLWGPELDAEFAANFAKLGFAYAAELSRAFER